MLALCVHLSRPLHLHRAVLSVALKVLVWASGGEGTPHSKMRAHAPDRAKWNASIFGDEPIRGLIRSGILPKCVQYSAPCSPFPLPSRLRQFGPNLCLCLGLRRRSSLGSDTGRWLFRTKAASARNSVFMLSRIPTSRGRGRRALPCGTYTTEKSHQEGIRRNRRTRSQPLCFGSRLPVRYPVELWKRSYAPCLCKMLTTDGYCSGSYVAPLL